MNRLKNNRNLEIFLKKNQNKWRQKKPVRQQKRLKDYEVVERWGQREGREKGREREVQSTNNGMQMWKINENKLNKKITETWSKLKKGIATKKPRKKSVSQKNARDWSPKKTKMKRTMTVEKKRFEAKRKKKRMSRLKW